MDNVWEDYKGHRFQLAATQGRGGAFTCSAKILCPDGSRREVLCQGKFATLEQALAAGRETARGWIDTHSEG